MKTILLDIDGTLLYHNGDLSNQILSSCDVLDGVLEKLNEWNRKGYYIILTTGRKECLRELTNEQLIKQGIFYDKLIMGLPRGCRVLINDSKPNIDVTAQAYVVKRNEGLRGLEI